MISILSHQSKAGRMCLALALSISILTDAATPTIREGPSL
jgi:hypothetical protein